jgi:hypothetical protein
MITRRMMSRVRTRTRIGDGARRTCRVRASTRRRRCSMFAARRNKKMLVLGALSTAALWYLNTCLRSDRHRVVLNTRRTFEQTRTVRALCVERLPIAGHRHLARVLAPSSLRENSSMAGFPQRASRRPTGLTVGPAEVTTAVALQWALRAGHWQVTVTVTVTVTVRFTTRPKSRTMRATRQLRPPRTSETSSYLSPTHSPALIVRSNIWNVSAEPTTNIELPVRGPRRHDDVPQAAEALD